MTEHPPDQIFISYSHRDKKWLEKLQTMLGPQGREESISVWDDTKIKPGAKWKEDIEGALAAAKVAVLLVSPHFLASDFIAKHEFPSLLEAARKKGVVILWIHISSCLYKKTEIADYQAAHEISKPLDSLKPSERNRVLTCICEEIEGAVNPRPKLERAVKQVEERQARQEREITAIKIALKGILTKHELGPLEGLNEDKPVMMKNEPELYGYLHRLDGLHFIQPHKDKGLRHGLFDIVEDHKHELELPLDKRPSFDLKKYVYVTDEGRSYLKALNDLLKK